MVWFRLSRCLAADDRPVHVALIVVSGVGVIAIVDVVDVGGH